MTEKPFLAVRKGRAINQTAFFFDTYQSNCNSPRNGFAIFLYS